MTRLWQPAEPVRVITEHGVPVQVIWAGERCQVVHVALHWRVRIWWRGVWRDYYKLLLAGGTRRVLVMIYRDLLTGDWYLQEVYD